MKDTKNTSGKSGGFFGISTNPSEDSAIARELIQEEMKNAQLGIKSDVTELEIPKKTEKEIEKKVNGKILVAGRRSAKNLNTLTIGLDKDVEELMRKVIHPSSNQQMTVNELLRISLTEIYNKHGEIIIK